MNVSHHIIDIVINIIMYRTKSSIIKYIIQYTLFYYSKMEDHYQLAGLSFLLVLSVEGGLLPTSEELFDPAGLLANNWLKKSARTF